MREILIASSNAHKAVEIRSALADVRCVFKNMTDLDGVIQPVEEGTSLEENALAKARAAHAATGIPALADDSGLEVDYLRGAPGAFSARYAGENVSYDANNRLLLERLAGIPLARRTARFRCVMALVDDGVEHTTEGVCRGHILEEPRGAAGFGYDPLFLPDGVKKTFAQMSREEKTRISHRGRALAEMRTLLSELYHL